MRSITQQQIEETVARLCMEANYNLNDDIKNAIQQAIRTESSARASGILEKLLENAEIARQEQMAICQDTGMAVVFADVGQDAVIEGSLTEAIQNGVRLGYAQGFLRKSVVADPLHRVNTKDNTPAIVHYNIVPGRALTLTVAPKGFGSENMSGIKMLKPSDGEAGVLDYVVELINKGGGNPCPPVIVGVGIGGTMEKAALMAKQALLLPVDHQNPDPYYAELEARLLTRINATGIGPMGWGGHTTALGVNILTYPTHIAGLPVAVNISCHVTRHASAAIQP